MDIKTKINPKLVVVAGVLGVSVSAIFARFSTLPSLILATYRLGFTVLLLLPFVYKSGNFKEIKEMSLKDLAICSAAGIFFAIHLAVWFESLKYTTIAGSTVLVDTDVIFVAIGYWLFLKGKIPKLGVMAICFAFVGSVITAMSDHGVGTNIFLGDIMAVVAAVFIASYTLIGRVQRKHISTGSYTFVVYISCFATLLVLDFITRTPIFGYGMKNVLIGLAMAVFCTLLGHSLLSWSLKYLSPGYVSATKLCEPVFATILGMFIFGEIPRPIQILGGVIIIGAVYLYSTVEKAE